MNITKFYENCWLTRVNGEVQGQIVSANSLVLDLSAVVDPRRVRLYSSLALGLKFAVLALQVAVLNLFSRATLSFPGLRDGMTPVAQHARVQGKNFGAPLALEVQDLGALLAHQFFHRGPLVPIHAPPAEVVPAV